MSSRSRPGATPPLVCAAPGLASGSCRNGADALPLAKGASGRANKLAKQLD